MCSISKHFSKQETRLSLYDTPCIPSRAYRCRPLATKTGFWWYPTFYRMVFSHIPTNFWLPSVHLAPGTITNGYQDRRKTESVYSSTNRATHLCKCNGMVDPLKHAPPILPRRIWSFYVNGCRHFQNWERLGPAPWDGGPGRPIRNTTLPTCVNVPNLERCRSNRMGIG